MVGIGLLVLGVVMALLLGQGKAAASRTRGASEAGSDEIYSAIPVTVNFPAPALSMTDLEGKTVALEDYLGRWVLVNNWATWCPPCKAEMPTLQAFYEAHQSQGFILVAIEAGDPKEEVASFVEEHGLTFPIWWDPTNRALVAFQNQSLPSSYLIDPTGTVRLAWTGAISRSVLEKYVTPLLEE